MPADPSRRRRPRGARAGSRGTGRETDEAPSSETAKPDNPALHLNDPRDIRALAHPARMAIIDALASGDELTATECAEVTGLSPSATAYHLKLLERYDLAERAPARDDGRERPWRASAGRTTVDLDASTPAAAAATAAVGLAYFDRTRSLAQEFIARVHEEPEVWQDAAGLANIDLWLTADEVREVTSALAAALEPYRNRTLRARPEDSRRVRIMNVVSPHARG
jgi:DNA-binding transcriptional ArsR family regulator